MVYEFRDDGIGPQLKELHDLGAQIRSLKKQQLDPSNDPATTNGEISSLVNTLTLKKDEVSTPLSKLVKDLIKQLVAAQSLKDGLIIEEKAMFLSTLLPTKQKKSFEKEIKKLVSGMKLKSFDATLYTSELRVQRKINHLLEHQGSGDDFFYHPILASPYKRLLQSRSLVNGSKAQDQPSCRDSLRCDSVILTEKWDGTTVQATNKGVFKRKDKFSVGDTRKHAASECDRYTIERLDLSNDGAGCKHGLKAHIKKAVQPYQDRFASFEDGLCCYFEAHGTNIQAGRFGRDQNGNEWHDIKVFDFSLDGKFLPWEQCCLLASKYCLPLVAHHVIALPLDLRHLFGLLTSELRYSPSAQASSEELALFHHRNLSRAQNEGFVIRQPLRGVPRITSPPTRSTTGLTQLSALSTSSTQIDDDNDKEELIAKIRVCDMSKVARELALVPTRRFQVLELLGIASSPAACM